MCICFSNAAGGFGSYGSGKGFIVLLVFTCFGKKWQQQGDPFQSTSENVAESESD
jgi:hypothetical protein